MTKNRNVKWTEKEINALDTAYQCHGNDWSAIANSVQGGRTQNQCKQKNLWYEKKFSELDPTNIPEAGKK